MILVYIINELSYDRYNENADRTYRITRVFYADNGSTSFNLGALAPAFGPLLQNDFPDIEKMTRLFSSGGTFKYGENVFNENNAYYADPYLFDVFTINTITGNPKKALSEPYSVMLNEEMAKKYFGNEDPMNKVIRFSNQYDMKVTGVYKSFPNASHVHPDILISFATLNDSSIYGKEALATSFGNNSFYTYILLSENYPVEKLQASFPHFIDEHLDAVYKNAGTPSKRTALVLQPLTAIHLHSHLDSELEVNGDISRVYIFSAIALFILLIAAINYMNLSTARSSLRAREIGVRKVVGAQRSQLILQFIGESVLLTIIAMVLALLLTWIFIPSLNKLSGQHLLISNLIDAKILIALVLLPLVTGVVSGIYPAVFLSSFQPVIVLKGLFSFSTSRINFRKALVVVQFCISIILIIGTVIIFQQLRFIQNTSLGYNKDELATMFYYFQGDDAYQAFRNEMLQSPSIKDVTRSSRIPSGSLLDDLGARVSSGDSLVLTSAELKFVTTDYEFFRTYDIQMLAGRGFSRDFGTDTSSYIINAAAVNMLGWNTAENAIGKAIVYGGVKGNVIGVTNDFHFESMHEQIVPMIFFLPNRMNYSNWVSVKMGGNDLHASIDHLDKSWKKFLPEVPLDYTFLDERIVDLYQADQRERTIFTIFSCIAIFIACLGLLGLSVFTISQRIKEIGIRKILGASLNNIVTLLSKDFLLLVLISAVIALPIAWWIMNQWLNEFAYRIQISWWVFAVATIIALIV
ncbi:MAG: FtsX-like permease family protein, partial [Chitinophagales bacterium]